jgi:hypothetical protein
MRKYSSKPATKKHIKTVRNIILKLCFKLFVRAFAHDKSKLKPPELKYFDIYTPKLAGCTYGSVEYKQFLSELKPSLDHHYAHNRHHPEHYPDGIYGMNLIDLLEMLADWYAATKRHNDGDIFKSIELNAARFNYDDRIKKILRNTIEIFNGGKNA